MSCKLGLKLQLSCIVSLRWDRAVSTINAFRRRLAQSLPSGAVRTIAGLIEDVKSIPTRLAKPERLRDPLQSIHNVGGGNYHKIGEQIFTQLIDHAGLRPDYRVLDIGCGTGRVAGHLVNYLNSTGHYVGFDVAKAAIATCRRRFREIAPHFEFICVDVKNGDYNHRANMAADVFKFPLIDESFDFVFATSVYSHMPISEVRQYLCETSRVLKKNGVTFFTGYLLHHEHRSSVMNRRHTPLTNWRDGSMVADRRTPERFIAHDEGAVLDLIRLSGLNATRVLRGHWAGAPTYSGWQDAVIAVKSV